VQEERQSDDPNTSNFKFEYSMQQSPKVDRGEKRPNTDMKKPLLVEANQNQTEEKVTVKNVDQLQEY